MDRERRELAQAKRDNRIPYLQGSQDDPGWYGGKIHFAGRLVSNSGGRDTFTVELEQPVIATSSRFTRRFGSHRFVRIRIDTKTAHEKAKSIHEYFQAPFIISGRVFRAFHAKENTVFLFMTNEVIERSPATDGPSPRVRYRIREPTTSPERDDFSLSDFLQWHNPTDIKQNAEQVCTFTINVLVY